MIRMGEQWPNPLISADSANSGNHLNGLTSRQDRALDALLGGFQGGVATATDEGIEVGQAAYDTLCLSCGCSTST